MSSRLPPALRLIGSSTVDVENRCKTANIRIVFEVRTIKGRTVFPGALDDTPDFPYTYGFEL